MPRILVVDDERSILKVISTCLKDGDFETITACSAEEALEVFASRDVDLMIVDLRLGEGMDGLELMHECRSRKTNLPIIMITAYGTIEVAVQAMKEGAYDFVCKPFAMETLLESVNRALRVTEPLDEDDQNRHGVRLHFGSLVGESSEMHRVYNMIDKVASTEATVLIHGESGTGKELVARAIHAASRRGRGPWVPLNCAAIPAALLESEMFGHKAGAFTGAARDRTGLFSEAHQGTLFLDEVGVMDYDLQSKLLRALQEGRIRPVGENRDVTVDARVIAATNEDLEKKKDAGRFREDLYYRLSVIPIHVPPLRHRAEDIPLLARYFAEQQAQSLGREIVFGERVMEALVTYGWPGNIRELQNAIACAATLSEDGSITTDDLPPNIRGGSIAPAESGDQLRECILSGKSLRDYLREKEQAYMEAVLDHTRGNRAKAADFLGISRATFYRKYPEVDTE